MLTCGTCEHASDPWKVAADNTERLSCFRFPPQVIVLKQMKDGVATGEEELRTQYPAVSPTFRACGEHKKRKARRK